MTLMAPATLLAWLMKAQLLTTQLVATSFATTSGNTLTIPELQSHAGHLLHLWPWTRRLPLWHLQQLQCPRAALTQRTILPSCPLRGRSL